jgi:uncharacterized repeat protein (TIGR03803 family)
MKTLNTGATIGSVSGWMRGVLGRVCLVLTVWLLGQVAGQGQTNLEIVLHNFTDSPDGAEPVEMVLGSDNALYGITDMGGTAGGTAGTIFKMNRDGSGYTILRSFALSETGDNGLTVVPDPGLSVMQGSDGELYGTTVSSGANGDGMVFKLNTDGSGYVVLHSFTNTDASPANLMQGRDGVLYGIGAETVFKLTTSGSGYAVLHTFTNNPDGWAPFGQLAQGSDGTLYGTTYFGGTNNLGTVFRMDTNGNGYEVLYNFAGNPDGQYPFAGVVVSDEGVLYGTTWRGGTNGYGTVFRLNTNGGGYTELYAFANSTDGSRPFGRLLQGTGKALYGTASAGGANSHGTVFVINQDGSGFDVLDNFGLGSDGGGPSAGVVQGMFTGNTGVLYGTTAYGGNRGVGTVFALLLNPPLSITPVSSQTASNQAVVFWPAWALNYTLQTTTNLASGPWATVSNGVPVAGVQVTNTGPASYFRLVR